MTTGSLLALKYRIHATLDLPIGYPGKAPPTLTIDPCEAPVDAIILTEEMKAAIALLKDEKERAFRSGPVPTVCVLGMSRQPR